MSEPSERLTAALAERYTLVRELGSGGMATVYLARDLHHDRDVAVKVLRSELASALGVHRFLSEIRITARLTHPNILTLIDSGEADGFLYYVMPYVEGESLRGRLSREKQLPLDDALRITREVADALSYAHSHDVIHRDIKPENILLEAGHAVIMDFGIARAITAAGGERLTETGLVVGTPVYMSPEQAAGGGELDRRTDVYALGCVLFEMLGGQPPFTGPTTEAVLHQHLTADAPPIHNLRPAAPPALAAAVARALAKAPADRFDTVAEFGAALTVPDPTKAGAGPRWKGWAVAGLAVAVLTAVALGMNLVRPVTAGEPRIAVLPPEHLGTTEDEYLTEGITDEITSALVRISGMRVVSRLSTMRFNQRELSTRALGDALDAEYLLGGTNRTGVTLAGARTVHVLLQLIRVADDVELWTNSYDVQIEPAEMLRVAGQIAEQIAGALNVELLEPERRALAAVSTVNQQAYESYLQGRFHWRKRTAEGLQLAEEHFDRAIAQDSNFAKAWSGLADTYALFTLYGVRTVSPAEAYNRAENAARRAIGFDSTLAEAHASLGHAIMVAAWDWPEAERELLLAIALDPDYTTAHQWYAEYLRAVGQFEAAVSEARLAVDLEPLFSVFRVELALAHISVRSYDSALVQLKEAVRLDPAWSFGHLNLLSLYVEQGLVKEATEEATRLGFPPETASELIEGLTGQISPEMAARVIAALETTVTPVLAAMAYAKVGLTDSAFARLDRALQERDAFLPLLKGHPWFDSLRADPRYVDLLRTMGLEP
ncbi:MAG: protein kinase [Gemmatimonadetes bacterium]|nr:protein kinase [Gemmatimonadota bacterium]